MGSMTYPRSLLLPTPPPAVVRICYDVPLVPSVHMSMHMSMHMSIRVYMRVYTHVYLL